MKALYTVEQIRTTLTPIFRQNQVRKATLFGSYSKGTASEHSDIDLLVDSGMRGMRFFGLWEDICNSLNCQVDLIDTQDVIPDSRIDHEIRQTGLVIYEQ